MNISKKNYDLIIVLFLVWCVWIFRIVDLPNHPIPTPVVADEFSNYLGAKTFAEGRLTNPAHEFTNDSLLEIYILSEPSRMMKYQPAMSGFMALGIAVLGDAYWGVLLLMSLAIASSYWAVRGWAGRGASLYVAVLLLLAMRVPHYFIDSYWGGAHALLGSFLIIGAYPRIIDKKQYGYIWAALFGVVILLLSRTYEGTILILSFSVCAIVTVWRKYSREEIKALIKNTFLPVIFVGGCLLAFQMHYNKVVTGDYLKLPYTLYQEQNGHTDLFWFIDINNLGLSNHYGLRSIQELEDNFYSSNSVMYRFIRLPELLGRLLGRIDLFGNSLILILFIITIVGIPAIIYDAIKRQKYIALYVCIIIQAVGYMVTAYVPIPHYVTVCFALLIIIIAVNLRDIYIASKYKYLYKIILAGFLIIFLLTNPIKYSNNEEEKDNIKQFIEKELKQKDGYHLVLIDQRLEATEKPIYYSFVYNELDIDSAKIIWAWYLSPQQNRKIIEYYKNRNIWYIEPYKEKLLIPYTQHKEQP